MSLQEAVRERAVGGERGGTPRPAPVLHPGRAGGSLRAGAGTGRGFRRALALSFAVHGAALALFAGDLLGGETPERAPLTLVADFEPGTALEPDLPPLDLAPPEIAEGTPPPEEPTEVLPEPPVPRPVDELARPGPLVEVIGITSPFGKRRGVPGSGGGGGAVGRTDTGPPAAVEGIALAPAAPREPVLGSPRLREDRLPAYPPALRVRGAEGEVRLRVEVAADGSVAGVSVAVPSGTPALDDAAVEAARAWLFDPATEDGRPVASLVFRWVRFHLTDRR